LITCTREDLELIDSIDGLRDIAKSVGAEAGRMRNKDSIINSILARVEELKSNK
jgi:hypothetical protein